VLRQRQRKEEQKLGVNEQIKRNERPKE